MNATIFWAITQQVVVIPYRRFGTIYRSLLRGSRIQEGHIFERVHKITRFLRNLSSGSRADTRGQTERRDDANKRFLRLTEQTLKYKN